MNILGWQFTNNRPRLIHKIQQMWHVTTLSNDWDSKCFGRNTLLHLYAMEYKNEMPPQAWCYVMPALRLLLFIIVYWGASLLGWLAGFLPNSLKLHNPSDNIAERPSTVTVSGGNSGWWWWHWWIYYYQEEQYSAVVVKVNKRAAGGCTCRSFDVSISKGKLPLCNGRYTILKSLWGPEMRYLWWMT